MKSHPCENGGKRGATIKMFCVYKHTFPNDKTYIGITSQNPLRRWENGFGYRKQPVLFRAICKYGWDNIKHEILYCDLTRYEAIKKEIELIAFYKSNQKEFGYNRDCGGSVPTEEMKKHLRQINLGKHHSEEAKAKMSAHQKGRKAWNKGLPTPQHIKDKIAEKQNFKTYQYTKEGKLVTAFKSAREASRRTGISRSSIVLCCNGKLNTAGGYMWAYSLIDVAVV